MPAPKIRIPVGLNLDGFQDNIAKMKSQTGDATQFIVKKFIDMNASVIASQGGVGGAVLGFRSLLGIMAPLSIAVTGVIGVFKLMGYATDLAKEKIEEFNEIATDAAAGGVSTDFFQRLTKSGEQLKLTVEDVSAALERFAEKSKDRLGGSDLQQRINQLREAGNLEGNGGVAALAGASNNEARLRAVVELIDHALEKGERLAALDIAERAFGSKVAENLRADAGYLDRMLETADKIAATEIITAEQVGQAIDLKSRLEDAQRVLEERFKPIQDDLAKLGMNYQESWVDIYQNLASAVGYANQLYAALKDIPDLFARAGNASFWKKLSDFSGSLGLNDQGMIDKLEANSQKIQGIVGRDALRDQLRNPANVARSMREASDVQAALRGDTSKAPGKAATNTSAPTPEDISAFDREIDRLNRQLALRQADTAAVGKAIEVQEQYRAELSLLQALERDGEGITTEQIAAYGRLRGEMGSLQALQAAGITLSGDQASAFSRISERALDVGRTLRVARDAYQGVNDSMKFFGDQAVSVLDGVLGKTQTFEQGMLQMLNNIQRQLLQAALTGEGVFAKLLGTSGSGGGAGGLFGAFADLIRGGGSSGMIGGTSAADFVGPQLPGNARGTNDWQGGETWVGENGPERLILPPHSQVIPNTMATGGYRGAPPNVSVQIVNNSDASVSAGQAKSDGNGGFSIEVAVDKVTARNAVKPGSATHQALAQNYGLKPQLAGR